MKLHRLHLTLLLAVFVLLVPTAAVAGPHQGPPPDEGEASISRSGDPPQVTFRYEVQVRGDVRTDPGVFANAAGDILGDARSWTLGGSVAFTRVSSDADFSLVIASPQEVGAAADVCSPDYSCRVGDDVLINDRNWQESTAAWRNAGAPLWLYRQYLINHEVGHYLGFGHTDCGSAGQAAPVMQQQSISLQECEPNGWPLDWERDVLGDRLGVPVYDWIFPDVLHGDTHREGIHRLAEAGTVQGYADGYFRATRNVSREEMATFVARHLDLDTESAELHFEDVDPSNVHADAIAALHEQGIVAGFEDGTYRPKLGVTRAQIASFLARAYELEAEGPPPYDDVDPDGPHADAIAAVSEAGIAQGYGDGTYRPLRDVSRGETATLLVRADG